MKYLVGAVNCIINKYGELIVDPDYRQSYKSLAQMTFVFENVHRNAIAVHTTGKFTKGQYNDAIILCREASKFIFNFYRETVRKFANVL